MNISNLDELRQRGIERRLAEFCGARGSINSGHIYAITNARLAEYTLIEGKRLMYVVAPLCFGGNMETTALFEAA
jgi:hypothetical protein